MGGVLKKRLCRKGSRLGSMSSLGQVFLPLHLLLGGLMGGGGDQQTKDAGSRVGDTKMGNMDPMDECIHSIHRCTYIWMYGSEEVCMWEYM